jgi:ribokinase
MCSARARWRTSASGASPPSTAESTTPVPGEPVDTTGAGDAFVGSLTCFLAAGHALPEAAERANRIAAIGVQARGTQTSFPSASELPANVLRRD